MDLAEQRFWQKVLPEPNSGCWLWDGADNGEGYGAIRISGVTHKAHRLSYQLFVGPIPDGLQIDHLCRVRCCVNPTHLEAVTQKTNIQRGEAAKRAKEWFAANVTHCPAGHEYTRDNLRANKYGHRMCATCHRERERARYYAKKRSA